MKYIYTFLFLLSALQLSSQVNIGGSGAKVDLGNSQTLNSFGFTVQNDNILKKADGTYYLFDKWENDCIIHINTGQRIRIKNINLNLERYSFESQIEGDSLFTFNFNNIDRFVINERIFKNFYWNDDNQVYEIVFEDEEYQILKGFRVLFVAASVDPMVARKKDKFVRTELYFLRKDNKILSFRLRKRNILKLFDDEESRMKVLDYAEQQDLSFKKEEDVKKILNYSMKNII